MILPVSSPGVADTEVTGIDFLDIVSIRRANTTGITEEKRVDVMDKYWSGDGWCDR